MKRVPGAAGGTQGRPRPPGRTRALCPGLNIPLFAGAAPRGSKRPDPDPNFWGHTHRSSPHPPRAASGHPAGSPLWGVLCAPPHFGVLPPRTPVLWVLGGGRQGPPPSLGTPGGGRRGPEGLPEPHGMGGRWGGHKEGGSHWGDPSAWWWWWGVLLGGIPGAWAPRVSPRPHAVGEGSPSRVPVPDGFHCREGPRVPPVTPPPP